MKKTLLAVLVPLVALSGAASAAEVYNKDGNKLDLYGKVDVRHLFSDNDNNGNAGSQDGDDSRFRIGIKGETQITDQLTGFGRFENEIKTNGTEGENDNKVRLAYAGLKFAEFGSLDYGRNYGVIYDTNAWTDVLPIFGNDTMTQTDVYMTGRAANLLTYRNTDFFGYVDGLSFALQYQGANDDNSIANRGTNINDVYSYDNTANGDGFGFSTAYDIGWGVSVGGAYSSSARPQGQKDNLASGALGDRAEAWNVGAKFDADNLYLAAVYGETRNMTHYGNNDNDAAKTANKTQNIELVAQYQFDFGLRPSIAYLQSKGKSLNNNGFGDDQDLVKYVDLGAYYYFNKNMSALIDYKINLLDENDFTRSAGINTDNVVGLGLVYQF
ncbi:porin [Morganella psychrotolerans]|uniref:Porin n=1 Tax=Morganella psychrotolerans TaxID=368603 RepID=A0A1B8HM08_9GAMM|nr:porin [Morganella psychrotolerans]OBU10340.1 porin [Morganella psychrotolerans]